MPNDLLQPRAHKSLRVLPLEALSFQPGWKCVWDKSNAGSPHLPQGWGPLLHAVVVSKAAPRTLPVI